MITKIINFFALSTILIVFAFSAIGTIASDGFAQNGTISGTGPKVKKFLAGSTRLYSLASTATFARELTANRSYKLTVPAGPYVVISEVLGKNENAVTLKVVSAGKGKRAVVQQRAAIASPPAVRVSVGNILLKTPTGKTIKSTSGKNITVDGLVIADLLNSNNSCGFAVFEDRQFGRFKDILKEVKLQSSKFAKDRINLKEALAVLNANAPQYRLTGSVEVTPDQEELTGNASLQIVNLETGEIVWQKTFTNGEKSFAKFSEPLAQAAADALCIPREISGTFTGKQEISGGGIAVTHAWLGSARFIFQSYLAEDPSKPTEYTAALYKFDSGEISSYSANGTNNGCSVRGEATQLQPDFPSSGILLVYLKPQSTNGYRYALSVSLSKQDGVASTITCPDSTDTRLDAATAELVTSSSEENLPVTPNLRSFSGAFTYEGIEMTWDFNSKL